MEWRGTKKKNLTGQFISQQPRVHELQLISNSKCQICSYIVYISEKHDEIFQWCCERKIFNVHFVLAILNIVWLLFFQKMMSKVPENVSKLLKICANLPTQKVSVFCFPTNLANLWSQTDSWRSIHIIRILSSMVAKLCLCFKLDFRPF